MAAFKRNLALVVGIDHYQNGIPPLKTATTDARALAKLFQDDHHYSPVWPLLNEQATYRNLKHLLEKVLPKEIRPDDRFIFYFAGHGIAIDGDDGPKGYLIPQDAKLGDSKTYLPMAEVHDALTQLPCRHFLGIFDCCFAGTFRWSSTRDLLALSESTEIFQERFDRFQKDPAWQVITSSADDETAYDVFALTNASDRGTTQNHSPFALALIEAFRGKADVFPAGKNGRPAGDGVITATELYLYLRDRVAQLTQKYSHPQTPGLWPLRNHRKGEFVFTVPGHLLNLPQAPELNEDLNPYRGLESFEAQHQHLFFGREDLIQELATAVSQQALTVVLGASGTGKSSLVKAGLVPTLSQRTDETWQVLPIVRPGIVPCQTLLQALQLPLSLADTDSLTATALIAALQQWHQTHPTQRLLLVIDQAEELYSLCRFPEERDRFLHLLSAAISNCEETLHVVLTLRSDFEPQFPETALSAQWTDSRFLIRSMSRAELRAAIEEPATLRVMYFEPPSLVETLIDEVTEMPGALPLLSFTLSELYLKYLRSATKRSDRAITEADYTELGGIKQSLIQRAEAEYAALMQKDAAYEQTMRHVMLRMVAISGNGNTRRQVPLSELEYPYPESDRAQAVIKRFKEARLLVSDTTADGQPYVEPAHDALVEGWPRLLQWLESSSSQENLSEQISGKGWRSWGRALWSIGNDSKGNTFDEREKLLLQRRLTPAANDWQREQKAQFLWHADARLPQLKQIRVREPNWFNTIETEFVQRSLSLKQLNARLRWSLAASLLAASTATTIFVLGQQEKIRARTIEAEKRSVQNLVASSKSQFEADQHLDAMLSALEAARIIQANSEIRQDAEITSQATFAIHQSFYGAREIHRLPSLASTISPNGTYIATVDQGSVKVWSNIDKEYIFEESSEYDVLSQDVFMRDINPSIRFSSDESTLFFNDDIWPINRNSEQYLEAQISVGFNKDSGVIGLVDNEGKSLRLDYSGTVYLEDRAGNILDNLPSNSVRYPKGCGPEEGDAGLGQFGTLWARGYEDSVMLIPPLTKLLLEQCPNGSIAAYEINIRKSEKDEEIDFTLSLEQAGKIRFFQSNGVILPSRLTSTQDGSKLLATNSSGGKHISRTWQLKKENAQLPRLIDLGNRKIVAYDISRDGKQAAFVDINGNILLWTEGNSALQEIFAFNGEDFKSKLAKDFHLDEFRYETLANLLYRQNYSLRLLKEYNLLLFAFNNKIYSFSLDSQENFTIEHASEVTSLELSYQQELAVSASSDGEVKVWDIKGNLISEFEFDEELDSVKMNNTGDTIVISFTKDRTFHDNGAVLDGIYGIHLLNTDGQVLKTIEVDGSDQINKIFFLNETELLVSNQNWMEIWDLKSDNFRRRLVTDENAEASYINIHPMGKISSIYSYYLGFGATLPQMVPGLMHVYGEKLADYEHLTFQEVTDKRFQRLPGQAHGKFNADGSIFSTLVIGELESSDYPNLVGNLQLALWSFDLDDLANKTCELLSNYLNGPLATADQKNLCDDSLQSNSNTEIRPDQRQSQDFERQDNQQTSVATM